MARSIAERVRQRLCGIGVAVALAVSLVPAGAASAAAATPTPATPVVVPTASPTPTEQPFTVAPQPQITGTARVGLTLTATTPDWSPVPAHTYQWLVDGVPVADAVGPTWQVTAAAAGKRVTVAVTGTLPGYVTTTVTSEPTAAVVRGRLTAKQPAISGTPTVGRTLTVRAGDWGPAPVRVTYQWLRDGAVISGATASSYKATRADDGRVVAARVIVRKDAYHTASRTTSGVRIGKPMTKTVAPTVSGTFAVGRTLTARVAPWSPDGVRLNYQWYRGSSRIPGATTSRYTLRDADGGHKIWVRVAGRKPGYTMATRSSTSRTVLRVLTVPASVSVTGDKTVGTTLTASVGTWGPKPVSFRYQWLRDGKNIPGAKGRTYRLTDADATHRISVRAAGLKGGYATVRRTSPAFLVKWAFASAPTPKITGDAKAGGLLTAKIGTWRETPDTLQVQWRVDGGAIAGATSDTFEVPAWAAGREITVVVTGAKKDFVTVTKTSPVTAVSWSLGSAITGGTSMRPGVQITSPNGRHQFGLLGDGNLVLSDGTVPVRSGATTGMIDGMLQFSGDGELMIVDPQGVAVWSTQTGGQGATALTIEDDGVARLVGAEGNVVWSSDALAPFTDASAAAAGVPGRYGWAFPILPSGKFTTYAGHSGDDIAAPRGTPVYAMRGGTVAVREIWITSGCPSWAPNRTRQKEVVVTSVIDGRTFVAVYAHLDAFSVKTGQQVSAGQKIGTVGSTGCSTGPHLHTAFTVDGERYALYPRDVLGVTAY
ncbi:peptidoglycan DD-metalloendopeptidase family protein [Microbacterium sp.]|uniref:peptidoglycan DD-metalloendopeptidase family protein n=1 Tax=Microbacterium sp. TaxID=51671 RepID=UPI003736CBF5